VRDGDRFVLDRLDVHRFILDKNFRFYLSQFQRFLFDWLR
jgi:hypothetical protein